MNVSISIAYVEKSNHSQYFADSKLRNFGGVCAMRWASEESSSSTLSNERNKKSI